VQAIRAVLAAGGALSTVGDHIIAEMWATSAFAARRDCCADPRAGWRGCRGTRRTKFRRRGFDECARVATGEGFPPPVTVIDRYRRIFSQAGSRLPSMLYDIENGHPTEGDHVVGDLVRRADRLGVEAPILRAALCNLQIYEAGRAQI
jgi:2-dehydropantoate 2-reductase